MRMLCAALFLSLLAACSEKDVYDPNHKKDPLPDESEYFDFDTKKDVNLYVNYDAPGFKALIEVYDEYPLKSEGGGRELKEGVKALFKIYTDENGKFEGKMNVPAALDAIFLYTSKWGLPACVKLEVKNGAVTFDLSKSADSKMKSGTKAFDGKVPYVVDAQRNLYSLCNWGADGSVTYEGWGTPINPGYILETVSRLGNESMGQFVSRMQNFLVGSTPGNKLDNSKYVKDAKTTNLVLKKSASVNLIFVNKDAEYNNTFGYYYYEGNTVDVQKVKKYIIFPRVYQASTYEENYWGSRILKCGDKIQLKYFGKDGNGEPSDKFPAGCTIGWFIYVNGFDLTENKELNIKPNAALRTTNDSKPAYIALTDKQSGKVILGVEDGANKSFCDLLFYTEATPADAIDDPNKDVIPDGGPDEEIPDVNESQTGTWAFEDIWPSGGDYDMNDVIVEYDRQISFNTDNKVTQITDIFKMVHDGASFRNAFAYQIDKGQFGDEIVLPEKGKLERETSSILVFPNAKEELGKTFTVTRKFNAKYSFYKQEIAAYNPYIIVRYVDNPQNKKRIEVHLPKHRPTDYADNSMNGTKNDAYYIDKGGIYPFAIDIPVINFKAVTESKHIDIEYPRFKTWAESRGTKDQDWYKK